MELRQEVIQWRANEMPHAGSPDGRSPESSPWLSLGDDLNRLFEAFFQSFETGLLSQFTDPCMFHQKQQEIESDKNK